jgi:hypothetical protein
MNGAGKDHPIGRLLAAELGWQFADLDDEMKKGRRQISARWWRRKVAGIPAARISHMQTLFAIAEHGGWVGRRYSSLRLEPGCSCGNRADVLLLAD